MDQYITQFHILKTIYPLHKYNLVDHTINALTNILFMNSILLEKINDFDSPFPNH